MQPDENGTESAEVNLLPVKSGKTGEDDSARKHALDARRTEINAYPLHSRKIPIQLPRLGRPFSTFAAEMGMAAQIALREKLPPLNEPKKEQKENPPPDPSNPNECFLCLRNGVVGRIVQEKNVARQHSGLVFTALTSDQAITELERWIQTGVEKSVFGKKYFAPSSMTRVTSVTLMASSHFHEGLPKVERIFDFAIPYGFTRKKPNAPKDAKAGEKTGGAEKAAPGKPAEPKLTAEILRMELGFNHYSQKNKEVVHYYCNRKLDHFVSVEWAKIILEKLFAEFDFADDDTTRMSRIHAYARLLTPYCQGLMGWRKRSPLWIFTADKPRAGKDYLAMLTPLVHSHWAVQDAPLESDDEVKRRITAALASGRRFMHFANCRKELDHPSLEAAITSEFWSDRIIRSSNEVTVPNEIIFSLSYNGKLPITADLVARSRQIRLVGKPGNVNAHEYKKANLHDLVTRYEAPNKEDGEKPNSVDSQTRLCRRNILGALEALIKNWAEQNCPHGPTFTSYPEWSQVVGGIMTANDLGDPCQEDTDLTAATADDWMDDFIKLAGAFCEKMEKEFMQTGDMIERFIVRHLDDYPIFKAYIEDYDMKGFAIQFGKYLRKKIGETLCSPDTHYVLQKHEFNSPNKFRFIIKSRTAPKNAAADPTKDGKSDSGHFDDYLFAS